ncbi:hypothetical protein KAW64_02785, partial [bacterium]|nr:hypothetical protein [bacterium]
MAAPYSSAAAVITATGIDYSTLELADDAALTVLMDSWLSEVANLIDLDRGREFSLEGPSPVVVVDPFTGTVGTTL